MAPDVVVDIGNTRIKFGRCGSVSGISEFVAVPAEDPAAWHNAAEVWRLAGGTHWAVASVHPGRAARFLAWLQEAGHVAISLDARELLPVRIAVDEPAKVGIDRLLSAIAANRRCPNQPVVVVSAGTAITVDFVTTDGTFTGGAIMPGLGMMAKSLHEQTALLPEVSITEPVRTIVGKNTTEAIRSGVFWSAVGGISFLATHGHQTLGPAWPKLFLTGGDGALFEGFFNFDPEFVPTLTLEGIRIAAEALP